MPRSATASTCLSCAVLAWHDCGLSKTFEMQHWAIVVLAQLWLPVGPIFPSAPGWCLCGWLWQVQAHGQFPCSSLLQQWQVQAFTTSTTHDAALLNGHALADVTIIGDLEPADVPCGFVHGPFRMRILAYEVGCSFAAGHAVWVSRWLCVCTHCTGPL